MVSIVITAYERPDMLARAVDSALAQTVPCDVVVVDDSEAPWSPPAGVRYFHRGRKDAPYLTWYEGVYLAQGELVAILHDDDWYEPTFIERTASLMLDGVGYVFTGATIHWPSREEDLWKGLWGDRPCVGGSNNMGDMLLSISGVISPSCTLHRRDELLRNLLPGGVPGLPRSAALCGPDMLLTLLPLLSYPYVAHVPDRLVHFTAHDKSTTIAEMAKDDGRALQQNYYAAKVLFHAMRNLLATVGDTSA